MKYDFLVVGLGFAGAAAAERLAAAGKTILAVDKRSHFGGNAFDYQDSNGILVHQYGPHIFHTNNQIVWDYLSRFTNWLPYEHKVLAQVDGRMVSLPVNLNTLYQLFDEKTVAKYEAALLNAFGNDRSVSILELRGHRDNTLKKLAEIIYEKIFLEYTLKQWGLRPDELDPGILRRVPIRTDRDSRYFKDQFQGLPRGGYTKLFAKMLESPRIEIKLSTDYREVAGKINCERIIFTGPIDDYFDFKYGRLAYRSIRFNFETIRRGNYQSVAVVNYPGREQFTRITEFKHFMPEAPHDSTTILREYPEPFAEEGNDPCYPMAFGENRASYNKYRTEAEKLTNVAFLGRLAEYRYYNMDEAISRALTISAAML